MKIHADDNQFTDYEYEFTDDEPDRLVHPETFFYPMYLYDAEQLPEDQQSPGNVSLWVQFGYGDDVSIPFPTTNVEHDQETMSTRFNMCFDQDTWHVVAEPSPGYYLSYEKVVSVTDQNGERIYLENYIQYNPEVCIEFDGLERKQTRFYGEGLYTPFQPVLAHEAPCFSHHDETVPVSRVCTVWDNDGVEWLVSWVGNGYMGTVLRLRRQDDLMNERNINSLMKFYPRELLSRIPWAEDRTSLPM